MFKIFLCSKWLRAVLPAFPALVLAGFSFIVPTACGGDKQPDAVEVADSFARAYFNYDFNKAFSYATPESRRWLSFAASNVYKADVDTLRQMAYGAEVETGDADYADDDSTATVWVNVTGAMVRDTIGAAGHVDNGTRRYALALVNRRGRWLVKMEDLPRSEKSGRD